MRQILSIFCLVVLTLWHVQPVQGQDSHYWDNQYGTRSELLGGLVVGSPTDLSSTFYNPGWISLQKTTSVLLTTKAAEAYRIDVTDRVRINDQPSSSTITASPGYLAGRFSIGNDYGWNWAYTYLQKVKFEYFATAINIASNPAPLPGEDFWSANESFRFLSTDESWYGVSFSRKLAENIGLGFSPFGVYRGSRSRAQLTSYSLAEDQSHRNIAILDEYSYWNFRLLLKIGLAIEMEKWTAGITVTTPSLPVMGGGEVHQQISITGDYDPNNPGEDPPFLSADNQPDLDSKWKSPVSVAIGAAYKVGQSKIHVTCEWFDHVSNYDIIAPEPYRVQSAPDVSIDYSLNTAAKNVFNYGLGVERYFSDAFSLYGSYRMDRSLTPDDQPNSLTITNWDLQHLSTGASFDFLQIEFTVGLQYSWGREKSAGVLQEFLEDSGQSSDKLDDLEYKYERIKALIGFNLPFGPADNDS